ncbi:hypothetical protein VCHA53O466_40099 [Vibrio chagasii]|nr:hypothetical protein VCHA53O466_40099 [Vibrio chagasii]
MNKTHAIACEHFQYLRDDFGLRGFMREFPQTKSISFLRWMNGELKRAPKDSKSIDIDVPEVYLDIAIFGLSIVAFKIITQTIGRDTAKEIKTVIERLTESKAELEASHTLEDSYVEDFKGTADGFRRVLSDNIRDMYDEVLLYGNRHVKWPVKIPEIDPKLNFNFQRGNSRSWAMGDFKIQLSLDQFVRGWELGTFFYPEYKSIARKLPIGEFETRDWRLPIYALICHEIAHTFQVRIQKEASLIGNVTVASDMSKAHGAGWQSVYKELRDKFVNPKLGIIEDDDGNFTVGGSANGNSGSGSMSLNTKPETPKTGGRPS